MECDKGNKEYVNVREELCMEKRNILGSVNGTSMHF